MNIIRLAIEVLLVFAVPVVLAEQKYRSLPADASEEEKERHRQLKVEDYNFEADEMINHAIANGVFPEWLGEIIRRLKSVLAPMLVRLANFTGYFEHNGNPPKAGQ